GGVTYDGKAWGSGTRAVLRATGDVYRSIVNFMEDHSTEPTIVRGFDMDSNNRVTTGVGINWPHVQRDLTGAEKVVEDCLIHDVYSRQSLNQYEYGIVIGNSGGRTVKNIKILYCKVYNISRSGICNYMGNDVPTNKSINVIIRGCEVYNTGKDPDTAGSGSGISLKNHVVDCIIEYNYIHDVKVSGIPITIHPHPGYRGAENAIIRHNIIRNCNQIGIWALNGGNKSFEIYGNLIMNNKYKGIWLLSTLADTLSVKIYNNTLYQNYASSDYYEILISKNESIVTCMEIKNNIIYASSSGRPLTDMDGVITDHSNNIYYRPGGGELVNITGTSYSSGNLSSWEPTAYSDSPNFKDTSNLPTGFKGTFGTDMEPNSDGLSVESGAAIDNGADLGDLYCGAINFAGKSGG
ncbi:right-handed parallel beta-helix repeat-containing protein, partial [bacterium]|nr:right-handed parallel beta-helix repeat-containing protein [bacterium]